MRDEQVQAYPDFSNPNIDPFDQTYLNSLPMVTAYGFSLCEKLGRENPALAVTNCDSVAYCALGKYFRLYLVTLNVLIRWQESIFARMIGVTVQISWLALVNHSLDIVGFLLYFSGKCVSCIETPRAVH